MSLESDIARLAQLQAGQREYKDKAARVRNRIIKALSPGEHRIGDYNVTISKDEYTVPDTERLKAALGERYEEYLKVTERWTVKANEVED